MRYAVIGVALLALVGAGGCGGNDDSGNPASGGAGSGGTSGKGGTAGKGGGGGSGGSQGGSGGATGGSGGSGGYQTLPWEGGPAYYQKWKYGPPSDESSFPIAVWLQSPSNASAYKDIGINTFIGLWEGPTDAQLSSLTTAGMPTLCAQEGVWSAHLSDPIIQGWTQQDEPDNAQPDGNGGYGPCIEPSAIVSLYQTMTTNDANRPVYLNFGQGVANTDWIGRGVCTGKTEMYPEYAKGADIVSFDIYPVASTDPDVHGKLELVPKGVDLLRQAVNNQKPVWVWIETTDIDGAGNQPTPEQIRSEVWMALIHGARGFGYFCHVFEPSFIEAGLLANASVKAGVQKLNQEVMSLAKVLNTPSLADAVTATSSSASVPVDVMAKTDGSALYVFAVGMAAGSTTAEFAVSGTTGTSAEVIGESRTIEISGGKFSDDFSSYAVHLYKIAM